MEHLILNLHDLGLPSYWPFSLLLTDDRYKMIAIRNILICFKEPFFFIFCLLFYCLALLKKA